VDDDGRALVWEKGDSWTGECIGLERWGVDGLEGEWVLHKQKVARKKRGRVLAPGGTVRENLAVVVGEWVYVWRGVSGCTVVVGVRGGGGPEEGGRLGESVREGP